MQNEVSQRKPFASFVPNGTPPLAFSRVRLVPHLGLTLCVATARLTKSKQAYLFIHFLQKIASWITTYSVSSSDCFLSTVACLNPIW